MINIITLGLRGFDKKHTGLGSCRLGSLVVAEAARAVLVWKVSEQRDRKGIGARQVT